MDAIRLGMVGCGEISHTHAEAAKSVEGVAFVSCCDPEPGRAGEWAGRYGCGSGYESLGAMLIRERLDALVLCTWPIQHVEQIELAMRSGVRNILCEKAMTLTGAEASRLWRLAEDSGAFIMEACKYRHHPAIRRIESILASGAMGAIDAISATFSNYEPEETVSEEARGWRYRSECGGGVPYDWMSYLVNAANHFAGSEPKRLFASGTVSERYGIITRLYGMIEYANGIAAHISSSKDASFSQELEIACSGGIINLPVAYGIFGNVSLEFRRRMRDWPYILADSLEIEHCDSFVLQMQNFADVIRGRADPVIPLRESVVNAYTIEGLARSVLEMRMVEIQLPELL